MFVLMFYCLVNNKSCQCLAGQNKDIRFLAAKHYMLGVVCKVGHLWATSTSIKKCNSCIPDENIQVNPRFRSGSWCSDPVLNIGCNGRHITWSLMNVTRASENDVKTKWLT